MYMEPKVRSCHVTFGRPETYLQRLFPTVGKEPKTYLNNVICNSQLRIAHGTRGQVMSCHVKVDRPKTYFNKVIFNCWQGVVHGTRGV